jgi:outer membrane protein assembly factor BamB
MWAMPYGDVVASFGSSEIMVQDAATGDVLWSKSTSDAFRNETHDTERDPKLLLGQRQGQAVALPWIVGDTMYYAGTSDLIGVDVHTGEELFRTIHTIPDENTGLTRLFFPWNMSVKDGVAYVLTIPTPGLYILKALDLYSGETLWSYEAGDPVEDWMDASTFLSQLVVTDSVVTMQVSNGENSILALDASDGSVLWQQPNALVGAGESIASSNISAINDQYLVLMHRGNPTGAIDGTPNSDQSLGVALYNLDDGYLFWSAREGTGGWTFPDQGTGACSLVPGWTSTDLYISCSTDDTVYLFNLPLSDNPSLVGTWETSARAYANFYDDQAAYLNTGTELLRIDYYSHDMTVIPITGGQACMGSFPPENGLFLCTGDDGLGTYSLQAYAQAPSIATPVASPVSAGSGKLPGDPGNTNAFPAAVDTSQTYVAESFGKPQMSAASGMVINDTLVFTGRPFDSDPESTPVRLYRQDLITGQLLWENSDLFLPDRFATDGSTAFALTYENWPPSANESPVLTAIDLGNGAVLWQSAPLSEYADKPRPQAAILPTEPIAIDGDVYVALGDGTILSFEGETGDVIWEYPGGANVVGDFGPTSASLVGNTDHLFAVMPGNTVVKLDRATGSRINILDLHEPERGLANIKLHLQGTRLVMTAYTFEEGKLDAMRLAVFDLGTDEPIWSATVESIPGEIVVTPTMIGIPQVQRTERPFILHMIPGIDDATYDTWAVLMDLETGEQITQIESSSEAGWLPMSASGEVICIGDASVTCIDRAGTRTVIQGLQYPEDSTMLVNQPIYHDGRIVILELNVPIQIAAPAP